MSWKATTAPPSISRRWSRSPTTAPGASGWKRNHNKEGETMQQIRLAVRQLVEFLLQTGDIDSRFAGVYRANGGARSHRKLQKQAGEGYQPEVFLSGSREVDGIRCTIEGRADGIFTDSEDRTVIDEIKTTGVPSGEISAELN